MEQKFRVLWPDNMERAEGDTTYFEAWLNSLWNEGWEFVGYTPGGYIFKKISLS